MSALVALKLLVGVSALLWWSIAAVRNLPHRGDRDGHHLSLARVPELLFASGVSGGAAVFLDAVH